MFSFPAFALSYIECGLATVRLPVLPTGCKIQNFIINSEWEQAREPTPSRKKKKKKKKEEEEEEQEQEEQEEEENY
jgi:hypothetical protein